MADTTVSTDAAPDPPPIPAAAPISTEPPISLAPASSLASADASPQTDTSTQTDTTAPAAPSQAAEDVNEHAGSTEPVDKSKRKDETEDDSEDDDETEPEGDSAVQVINRCMRAWHRAYKKEIAGIADDQSAYPAEKAATEAYLALMPILSGYRNICDFIACINHASMQAILSPIRAEHYMANAKIAISAIYHRPKPISERRPVGRPPKSSS